MNIRKALQISAILLLQSIANISYGDIAVIVNKQLGITQLTQIQVADIFLDKTNVFPNQAETLPIVVPPDSALYQEFIRRVVKRTPVQLDAYWARLIFTGKGSPPKTVDSSEEVLDYVIENENAIGYIDLQDVNDQVKVVFILQ